MTPATGPCGQGVFAARHDVPTMGYYARSGKHRRDPITVRICGSCTACCTALAVTELNKPVQTLCPHAAGAGCGIYEQRPPSCRAYQCLWLQSHLTDADRPDELGVIFTTAVHPEHGTLPMLVECRSGALSEAVIQTALARLMEQRPVMLMDVTGARTLLPAATPPSPEAA
jgi:hypothetical protein